MAEARLLRRPAAALLRRLVGRVRSADSGATAARGKRLGQSAGVVRRARTSVMYGRQTRIEIGAVVGGQTHHQVIIIGAGFAGLGMAIRLQQHELPILWCWNRPPTWAARGETTAIRAAPATCRRRCIRSRSNSIRSGRAASPATGRSGTTTALRAAPRADTAYPLAPRGAGRSLESRTALLAGQHLPRRVDLRRADHRDWPAVRTEDPESSRAGNVSGKGVPLRALGLRLRPARPTGSGGRHRRVRRPVRPEDPAHGRPARIGCRPPTAPAGRRTR